MAKLGIDIQIDLPNITDKAVLMELKTKLENHIIAWAVKYGGKTGGSVWPEMGDDDGETGTEDC